MTTVRAVYLNGVLRPTRPLDLADGQTVELTVAPTPAGPPTEDEIAHLLTTAATFGEWVAVTKLLPHAEGSEYAAFLAELAAREARQPPEPFSLMSWSTVARALGRSPMSDPPLPEFIDRKVAASRNFEEWCEATRLYPPDDGTSHELFLDQIARNRGRPRPPREDPDIVATRPAQPAPANGASVPATNAEASRRHDEAMAGAEAGGQT